jgi:hypothetical protein
MDCPGSSGAAENVEARAVDNREAGHATEGRLTRFPEAIFFGNSRAPGQDDLDLLQEIR